MRLDQIKNRYFWIQSTSFFQRIPPPSETEAKRVEQEQQGQQQIEVAEPETKELGIVPVSDSESEQGL